MVRELCDAKQCIESCCIAFHSNSFVADPMKQSRINQNSLLQFILTFYFFLFIHYTNVCYMYWQVNCSKIYFSHINQSINNLYLKWVTPITFKVFSLVAL